MQFYSPLRYPGGKNKLAKFVGLVCEKNNLSGHYVEPYAGGASVALYLLINGLINEITINDLDPAIHAFWHSVLNDSERLCKKIASTEVNIESWKKQKKIHSNKDKESDLFKLGFATFFLNRTNRSGILDGGVIGGLKQDGTYKIDCRFNKKELIARIKLIASFKDKIHLYNLDALELINVIQKSPNLGQTIFYFDPPYYLKGPSLYMSHYKQDDHVIVSEKIKSITNAKWIVSYDNTPEIKRMYNDCSKIEYSFFHMAFNARIGNELLFFSHNIHIPEVSSPTGI